MEIKGAKEVVQRSLRILNYNVWFDSRNMDTRVNEQIRIFRREDPDVICLQEVTPKSLSMYRSNLTNEYQESPNTFAQYGVKMFVKKELRPKFGEQTMPTYMGRSLVFARVHLSHFEMLVCTCHLESLNNQDLRERQLKIAAKYVLEDRVNSNSVLCGDFNFDSDRNFSGQGPLENDCLAKVLPFHTDAWPALHDASEKGYTFDTETNPILSHMRREERMRYDRIMFKTDHFVARRIYRIGLEPIVEEPGHGSTSAPVAAALTGEGDECPSTPPRSVKNSGPPKIGVRVGSRLLLPSDHYGLVCDFDLVKDS